MSQAQDSLSKRLKRASAKLFSSSSKSSSKSSKSSITDQKAPAPVKPQEEQATTTTSSTPANSNQAAMADPRVTDLFSRNKDYVGSYKAPPSFAELGQNPDPKPAIVCISCCDARLIPEEYFKFSIGEVLVIRNAGGRAMDAMRTLHILDQVLGVGTVIVVHHTDCGLTHTTDEKLRKGLLERVPGNTKEVEAMKFGEIKDLHESLKQDVAFIKSSPYFKPETKVMGYLFDLFKGTLTEVASS